MHTFRIKSEDFLLVLVQIYELKYLLELTRNGGHNLPPEYICFYSNRIKELVFQLSITWNKIEMEQQHHRN